MNIKRLAGIQILILILVIGCSGNNGTLKTQSKSDSKTTERELIDNWSDYNIWYIESTVRMFDPKIEPIVVMFDPKNDNKKILVPSTFWGTVKDQETWAKFVKADTTIDGKISTVGAERPMTGVREIWGPDKQLYGFIIHQQGNGFSARLVEKNTLRLHYYNRRSVGGPAR